MNKFEFEAAATEVITENFGIDADFYAGTLFTVCSSAVAARIQTLLIERMKCGVIVSKVGPETAFDFVGV
jgi:hypothetical protein